MVLTFEDTPFFDWLKKNRFFLLGLTILIVGIQGYQYYAPGLKYAKQAEAWDLFDALRQDLQTDFDTNLSPSLAQAEEYPSIYPWVVFAATNTALTTSNETALATLRPKLEALSKDADASHWKSMSSSGEVTPIAAVMLRHVEESQNAGAMVWENPEPQGSRVKMSVNSSLGSTYEFTVGLFEEAAPEACNAFLEAVDTGALVGLDVSAFGTTLTFRDYAPENEEGLPVERRHGLFHLAGTLSTTSQPGEPGSQIPDAVILHLQDSFGSDGITSVFGAVVEGLPELQTAFRSPAGEGVTFAITEATAL